MKKIQMNIIIYLNKYVILTLINKEVIIHGNFKNLWYLTFKIIKINMNY